MRDQVGRVCSLPLSPPPLIRELGLEFFPFFFPFFYFDAALIDGLGLELYTNKLCPKMVEPGAEFRDGKSIPRIKTWSERVGCLGAFLPCYPSNRDAAVLS